MKKIIAVLLLSLLVVPSSYSALEGRQPYTPTALDHLLAICLRNAAIEQEVEIFEDIRAVCQPLNTPNTIRISVYYTPASDEEGKNPVLVQVRREGKESKAKVMANSLRAKMQAVAMEHKWTWPLFEVVIKEKKR